MEKIQAIRLLIDLEIEMQIFVEEQEPDDIILMTNPNIKSLLEEVCYIEDGEYKYVDKKNIIHPISVTTMDIFGTFFHIIID